MNMVPLQEEMSYPSRHLLGHRITITSFEVLGRGWRDDRKGRESPLSQHFEWHPFCSASSFLIRIQAILLIFYHSFFVSCWTPSSFIMFSSLLCSAALLSLANAHGVILAAQGIAGSNTSIGFQVDTALARNCTTISPCQQDTTIIRDAEITSNVVNECGRTELTGNIDVGENTENQLAAGTVTQVKAGTPITVTLHQVNADGAGPYACDLDPTG
jgi:hypothetical protein